MKYQSTADPYFSDIRPLLGPFMDIVYIKEQKRDCIWRRRSSQGTELPKQLQESLYDFTHSWLHSSFSIT